MKKIILFLLFFSTVIYLTAQNNEDTVRVKSFPAQASIYYPIGTSGKSSIYSRYNLSFNLIYGKTRGVNGIEMNVGVGFVDGDIRGLQFSGGAGIGNNIDGIQISGLISAANNINGLQISGVGSLANNVRGLQLSSLLNVGNNVDGIQLSGIAGVGNDIKGLQLTGIVNIANDLKGIQLSGLIGVGNNITGSQISCVNFVNDIKGLQFSGFLNVTNTLKGFQMGGLANIVNNLEGVQLTGIFNRVNVLKGFQFGILNITDTISCGIPMGLVSIVKKGGYKQWELYSSDIVNVGVSFKMGIKRFYSIYSVGYNFINDNLFAAGFGFGSNIAITSNNKYEFQPELINFSYFPNNFKDIRYTNATQLRLGFVRNFGKIGILLAPSLYLSTMDKKDGIYGYDISPIGTVYNKEYSNNKISIGIGYTIAINIK